MLRGQIPTTKGGSLQFGAGSGGSIGGVAHYFFPWTQLPSAATVAATTGVWVAWPMYFPGLAITKLCCELTTAGVGNGRIALWDSDPASGLPAALLADSGNFSVNVALGILENTISSFTFPDQTVWIGFNANVAASFRQGSQNFALPITSGTDFQGVRRGVSRTVAFGAPPDPYGTPAGTVFGGPLLAVKA